MTTTQTPQHFPGCKPPIPSPEHVYRCVRHYPALLAALKKLSGEVLDLSERYDEEDVISEPARLALKEAISAIAQAEGRP